jgi:hypothetical protein
MDANARLWLKDSCWIPITSFGSLADILRITLMAFANTSTELYFLMKNTYGLA